MTPAPWQGDRPPDRTKHTWRCLRPPLEDFYTYDRKTGESVIRRRCPSCGAYEPEAERGGAT